MTVNIYKTIYVQQLTKWCKDNRMYLNTSKCFLMSFSTTKYDYADYPYKINGERLQKVDQVKDLGVLLDRELSFRPHYEYLISSCYKMIGFLSRIGKDFRNPRSLILLYYSFIRSKLEYCAVIWTPFYQVHIDAIERVQARFLRMLTYRYGLKYTQRSYLSRRLHFKVSTLENRRTEIMLTTLHKILHSTLSTTLASTLNLNIPNSRPRAVKNRNTFHLPACKSLRAQHDPFIHMRRLYNNLNNRLDIFVGLYRFRSQIRNMFENLQKES